MADHAGHVLRALRDLAQSRDYTAIQTGLMLTPTTAGILLASAAAGGWPSAHPEVFVSGGSRPRRSGAAAPRDGPRDRACSAVVRAVCYRTRGRVMPPPRPRRAVEFPDSDQGEISGLSRSDANLGSSLGVALGGSSSFRHVPAASRSRSRWHPRRDLVLGLRAALLLPHEDSRRRQESVPRPRPLRSPRSGCPQPGRVQTCVIAPGVAGVGPPQDTTRGADGERVSFASNGAAVRLPRGAGVRAGPGVVVIQDGGPSRAHHRVADRLPTPAFVALAPDPLPRRRRARARQAGKLLMGLAMDRPPDIAGAAHALAARAGWSAASHVGFCMGARSPVVGHVCP